MGTRAEEREQKYENKRRIRNKNGRDACAYRPEFVCEVVRPANREQFECRFLVWRGRGAGLLVPGLLGLLK
jgi:hypothetical protein